MPVILVLSLGLGVGGLFVRPSIAEAPPNVPAAEQRAAPLFGDLGDYHHTITTRSPMAQRYFDQGLTLVYGFNHAEAIRSFEAAAKHDPNCAMAYWGIALAYGPNINAPMTDDAVPKASAALQKAVELSKNASPEEQAYIQALAKRYTDKPLADRAPLDHAYADAMRQLSKQYPDDLDAATLFAESLMDTMPWSYWTKDLQTRPATVEAIATLESVLARNPDHPGAIHYYIHVEEAGPQPQKALAGADRLCNLVPGAGHLVHMPSHIYARVGLYHDASLANERAIQVDQSYINQCNRQGFYPAMYYPHNIHFLWHSSAIEGRSATSLQAARQVAEHVTHGHCRAVEASRLRFLPLLTLARFGQWEQILAEPEPEKMDLYESAMWHYARGLACSATGKFDPAEQEASKLEQIVNSDQGRSLDTQMLPGTQLITLALHDLRGDIALRRGQHEEAIKQLQAAMQMEDDLPYMEPPFWYYPVRQVLGSAMLHLNRPVDADRLFRQDLEKNPHNGWSLYGLTQSLRAQGKNDLADETQARFQMAWLRADVTTPPLRYAPANAQAANNAD
jgi:tetratricopeptide (TPR) repeat protein